MKPLIVFSVLSFSILSFAQPPDTLWSKQYGAPYVSEGYALCQTQDGGFVIVGRTASPEINELIYVVRTTGSGDTVWTRKIGEAPMTAHATAVKMLPDNGCVVAGYVNFPYAITRMWLARFTADGDILWAQLLGTPLCVQAHSVNLCADGGYILAGWLCNPGDMYLIKTDSVGTMEWERVYGGPNNECAYFVCQTADGGFISGG